MVDWIQVLYSDVISWLMDPADPAVRYWTLTRLRVRAEDAAEDRGEVGEARQAIMARGPAAEILAHYAGDGRWEGERGRFSHRVRR